MNIFASTRISLFIGLITTLYTNNCFAHITQDLELDKIFESIDRTHTLQGKKSLRKLLASPTADVTLLRNRQSVISHFCHDNCIHKDITTALKDFSAHEKYLNDTATQTNSVENASLEGFYFSSELFKKWNTNPIGLELGQVAHFANLVSSSVQHLLSMLILNWGLGEKHVCASHPKKDKHHHDHDKKNGMKYLKGLFNFWHSAALAQELYGVYKVTCKDLHIIKELQQQLISVAQSVHAIKSVHALLEDQPEITSHLTLYHDLDAICRQVNISKKLNALLTLLEMPTFKGKPSVFSRTGNILAAYKLLQEVADELEPALQAIGEIDACSSCAQLLAEHQTGSLRYSFAQYETDQTTPQIQTDNFWHPLIDTTDVTLNSLSLGIDNHTRNALFTGPNECGKSTNLKLITLCVYLAQTLSIVPAEQHCQTVFKEIYSSMVVADQLQQGKSLFATELENAHALLQRIETLAPGEYIFVALDELFKSTQHEKGQKVAHQLLKKLYACPHVITVATTHFEELAELAKKIPLMCTNYTIKNFRLMRGIGAFDDTGDDYYFN